MILLTTCIEDTQSHDPVVLSRKLYQQTCDTLMNCILYEDAAALIILFLPPRVLPLNLKQVPSSLPISVTMKTIMKLCGLFAMIGFSCAQRICTADDVVLSLSAVQYLADKMQLLVDTNNNNIDPSGVSGFSCSSWPVGNMI